MRQIFIQLDITSNGCKKWSEHKEKAKNKDIWSKKLLFFSLLKNSWSDHVKKMETNVNKLQDMYKF